MQLSDATVRQFADRLDVPTYDRSLLRPSIVHIGVGGFHRTHQAVYLDSLARTGNREWGEVGVGLRCGHMKEALLPQDCLFTVVEREGGAVAARVVGSMRHYLFAPDAPHAVVERLADPMTRVVTLTITGDGYNLDARGDFREHDPGVLADLRNPTAPITWFGHVVAALQRRRAAGLPGFTVLSCDNLPDSGAAARTAVLSFAAAQDAALAAWIERNVTFPNSMVDRITPRTDASLIRQFTARYGVTDHAVIATEPFSQWVVEDSFCDGRPPLEDVGAHLVSDVTPYKLAKSRLLNGSHSAMAYLGYLAGHRTTSEALADPVLNVYLRQLMRDEIAPILPAVPGVNLEEYQATLIRRFSNESISDPLSRLCGRGSTKIPSYLLPSLVERRRRGLRAPLLSLALAGWFRYLRGFDMTGSPIDVQDVRAADLGRRARLGGTNPAALLRDPSIMGCLANDVVVRRDVARALGDIDRCGPLDAIRAALQHGEGAVIPLGRGRELGGAAEPVFPVSVDANQVARAQSGSVA
jgi:mannitol 2-dehydrogenase